jgi:hypothetical protein
MARSLRSAFKELVQEIEDDYPSYINKRPKCSRCGVSLGTLFIRYYVDGVLHRICIKCNKDNNGY